jgi:hypothetical protein
LTLPSAYLYYLSIYVFLFGKRDIPEFNFRAILTRKYHQHQPCFDGDFQTLN